MDRKRRGPDEEEEPGGASLPPDPENAGFLPELLRRGLTLGFTGFFMTEEALRRALGDSVPRDWIEFFVEQSDRTRVEFLDRMSTEFGRVLNALDPVEVLRRLLDGQTIEVKASVRLANSKTGEKTSTRVRARSHRSEEED